MATVSHSVNRGLTKLLFCIVSSNNCVSSAVAEDEKLRSSINAAKSESINDCLIVRADGGCVE